jgi:NAD(P)-dependent dehydrogenase (short-subunit alcohol dehydrogenase family)
MRFFPSVAEWETVVRVVILGGTGGIGQGIGRLLATSADVERIVVVSRSQLRADTVAASLGHKAAGAVGDIADQDRLLELLSGADMLVNAAGPDFAVPLPALKAAIRARTNYVDVSADGRMTDHLLALDDEARSAGTTAVIGMGFVPGLSNLIAMHTLRKLDVVSDFRSVIVWDWWGQMHDAGATAAAWRASAGSAQLGRQSWASFAVLCVSLGTGYRKTANRSPLRSPWSRPREIR